jgi:hypothetical protein
MKFHLARPALVLAASLSLASCGGGDGSDSYPVKVTVFNLQYPGLVLATNGMELSVAPPAKAGDNVLTNFPKNLDYGTYYNVIPKGGTANAGGGSQPAHQTCVSATGYGYPREYGTAGQTASLESARTPAVEVFYTCSINQFELSGTITGLTAGNLVLINGSNSQITVAGSTTTTPLPFSLAPVPYGTSFGVNVLSQPDNLNCTVANGTGEMKEAQEAAGGVKNVTVTCVPK